MSVASPDPRSDIVRRQRADLDGRVVAVTGGGGGLGSAMARRFAEAGAAVALCDADFEAVSRVAEDLDIVSPRVLATKADVGSSGEVEAWFQHIRAEVGSVDVLVNNAGILRDVRVEHMTDDDWESVVRTHLRGAFNCIRAALPSMKVARYGRIISISSISHGGNHGQANYSAAKAGLVGLSKTVAIEAAPFGVTSNVIAPGPIDTPLLASVPPIVRTRLADAVPVGRLGRPEDVAAVALFLASEGAAFVTGTVVEVDGGMSLAGAHWSRPHRSEGSISTEPAVERSSRRHA